MIDKDHILESLFETKGLGDSAWRKRLSRESDQVLQNEAMDSIGAILVSFWRLPGMPLDSGTPVEWLSDLPGSIVNVHCVCAPETAAVRFLQRKRHPGHLDARTSSEELLTNFRRIAGLGTLNISNRIEVDTSQELVLDRIRDQILEISD
ncbi:MAG TPA: hypothetical protein VEZ90_02835 [Blastocatellia bacterium]|nr:hypothetical protein [Blastocatellia bacterium]